MTVGAQNVEERVCFLALIFLKENIQQNQT